MTPNNGYEYLGASCTPSQTQMRVCHPTLFKKFRALDLFLGSSQFVLNQLGLISLSPDPFCPFSTGPCFIGPLEFCPLVSSSCFISDSCYFVLDPIGPHPFRPWPNSPLISSSSWHFVFLFSYSVIFVLFQIALCYFVTNRNRPSPLRP